MTLSAIADVFGLFLGFLSSVFFCIGALSVSPGRIREIAVPRYDINKPWADELAQQRADYIVGGTLLLLSFVLQCLAKADPLLKYDMPIDQSATCVFGGVAFLTLSFGLVFWLIRNAIAKSAKQQIAHLQESA
jgi:hypothetical protein